MESYKDHVRVPMLEKAEQWATWEYKIAIALKAGDVYNVVKGTEVKPAEGADDYAKKLAEWEKKDFKAQRIITETISEEFTLHLLTCTTSKEVWDKMHLIFEQQGEANKHALQQKFFSFQKDPNDNIAIHIAKLNKLVLQLRNAGVTIDESMVITRIIMTLPKEIRHFGSSWDATAQADRTLLNLTNRLLAEETRCMSENDSNEIRQTAFVSREKATNTNKRKPGKCFNCGRKGHWKNECREKEKEKSSKDENTEHGRSFFADDETAFICIDKDDDESFALDSAASKHMCNKRDWFTDYVELQQPKGITIGNGEKMYAFGRGNISIQSFNGKDWINAKLYGVLYVPKLHRNLFSSVAVMDKGCKVYTDRNKCEITKNGSIVAVGARNGKLFHMKFKVKQPEKRGFAIVNIQDDNLVEANQHTPTNENIASKSICDKANKNDDASQSSVYSTASDNTEKSDEAGAMTSKIDTQSSDEVLSKQTDKHEHIVLHQQQNADKVKDRRKSTVCDVMQENIIPGSRLRGVKEANKKKNDGSDSDTAYLAIIDEPKRNKKKNRRKVIKKNR